MENRKRESGTRETRTRDTRTRESGTRDTRTRDARTRESGTRDTRTKRNSNISRVEVYKADIYKERHGYEYDIRRS